MPIMTLPFGRNATTVRSCAEGPLEKYQAPTIGEVGSVSRGKMNVPSDGLKNVRAVSLAVAVCPGGNTHEVEGDGTLQNPHSIRVDHRI